MSAFVYFCFEIFILIILSPLLARLLPVFLGIYSALLGALGLDGASRYFELYAAGIEEARRQAELKCK